MKTRKLKMSPLPWKWVGDSRKKMSAVVDDDGKVVCGSLICQRPHPHDEANHKAIVTAMAILTLTRENYRE